MRIWFDGNLTTESRARISVKTHALHYGTSAFEGIRFYDTGNGASIFRAGDHIDRLFYSAETLGMKIPYSQRTLLKAMKDTIHANKLRAGYIRPIVFYGDGGLGINPKNAPIHVAIITLGWGDYLPQGGITLKVVKTCRINKDAFRPDAKIGGAYMNSVLAHTEAIQAGYDEALLLDGDGYVAEGSGENIFCVKGDTLYTPKCGNILPGITRDSIMTLAKEEGWNVKETHLTVKDLKEAGEVFLTGTAAEVTAVSHIDRKRIGDLPAPQASRQAGGKPGPKTAQLRDRYHEIAKGKRREHKAWRTLVE